MPIIRTTSRLIIKSWAPEDLLHYLTLSKDKGYNCFSPPEHFSVKSDEEALRKIQQRIQLFNERGLGKFPLLDKETNEFIGTCGMEPYLIDGKEVIELGYRLCHKHWGRGHATEAARSIINYGFEELKLPKIVGFAADQNVRSIAVLTKLGFHFVGNISHAGTPHQLYEIHSGRGD